MKMTRDMLMICDMQETGGEGAGGDEAEGRLQRLVLRANTRQKCAGWQEDC